MKKVILVLVFVLIATNIFARNVEVTIQYKNEWEFEYMLILPASDTVKIVGKGNSTFMIPIVELPSNGSVLLSSSIYYTLKKIKRNKPDEFMSLSIELLKANRRGPTTFYQASSDGEILRGIAGFVILDPYAY